MQIEVSDTEAFLKEFIIHLEMELKNEGFKEGPQAALMGTTQINTYVKGATVVTSHIVESDSGECVLHLESEKESAELKNIWDKACIAYGESLIKRIIKISQDPKYVRDSIEIV